MTERPAGTVTFLVTDIEQSTRRWEDDPEAMRGALAKHDATLRDAIERHGGWMFKHTGDGVLAAFDAGKAGDRSSDCGTTGPRTACAHGRAHRRGRAARQRLLRTRDQSRGARHGRRAWRTDHCGGVNRRHRRWHRARRSRRVQASRSLPAAAAVSGEGRGVEGELSTVAHAGFPAGQFAGAGDELPWPRQRSCRSAETVARSTATDSHRRRRRRQDAARGAGRGRCCGQLTRTASGLSSLPASPTRPRSVTLSHRFSASRKRQGKTHRGEHRRRTRRTASASRARQLRTSDRGQRRASQICW